MSTTALSRRERALEHYRRYEAGGNPNAPPRKPAPRSSPATTFLVFALFLYVPVMLTLFVVGSFHPGGPLMAIAVIGLGLPIICLAGAMWLAMTLRFSRNPIARILFGGFTLMLFGTGLGWFANFMLFLWVMDSKPDIFTNEPLAAGPKRDAWLAARRPQQQTVNIDARQVHIHG